MGSTIPKRIIQVWGGGSDLPLLSKAVAANLRLLNPDFEYLLFDDVRMDSLIKEQFPEYQTIFQSFRFPIQRYDFFRYLAVYNFGGFYFDVDLLLAESLEDLLDNSSVFTFEMIGYNQYLGKKYNMYWDIGNYAFGSAPGHPFIRAIIENCVRAHMDPDWTDIMLKSIPWVLRKDAYVICSTGPGLVSRTYAENRHLQATVKILFPENIYDLKNWNQFGRYGIHLSANAWRKKENMFQRKLFNYCFRKAVNRNLRIAQMNAASGSCQPS
jgi:hypothetical protein